MIFFFAYNDSIRFKLFIILIPRLPKFVICCICYIPLAVLISFFRWQSVHSWMSVQMPLSISVRPSTNSVLLIVEKDRVCSWTTHVWNSSHGCNLSSLFPALCFLGRIPAVERNAKKFNLVLAVIQNPLSFFWLLSLCRPSIISHSILLWSPRPTLVASSQQAAVALWSAVSNTSSDSFKSLLVVCVSWLGLKCSCIFFFLFLFFSFLLIWIILFFLFLPEFLICLAPSVHLFLNFSRLIPNCLSVWRNSLNFLVCLGTLYLFFGIIGDVLRLPASTFLFSLQLERAMWQCTLLDPEHSPEDLPRFLKAG